MSRHGHGPQPFGGQAESRLAVRLGVFGLLISGYYAWDWLPLRLALQQALEVVLALFGESVVTYEIGGEPFLLLSTPGLAFAITSHCTYADLALTLAPFAWRCGRPWLSNAGRLAVLVAAVLIGNLLRLTLAVAALRLGWSWHDAHHAPDVAIHVATISTVLVLALRADLTRRRAEPSPAPPVLSLKQ